ncbi:MAG TPA: hypothetical protein VMM60_01390 [Ilumatobacter sp.]|nr:hypothetical protein [Ilumatobacter sp.]
MPAASVFPTPSPEEAVAIMAATEALWPKPYLPADEPVDRTLTWRFSGRWWQRDRFIKAGRPWS